MKRWLLSFLIALAIMMTQQPAQANIADLNYTSSSQQVAETIRPINAKIEFIIRNKYFNTIRTNICGNTNNGKFDWDNWGIYERQCFVVRYTYLQELQYWNPYDNGSAQQLEQILRNYTNATPHFGGYAVQQIQCISSATRASVPNTPVATVNPVTEEKTQILTTINQPDKFVWQNINGTQVLTNVGARNMNAFMKKTRTGPNSYQYINYPGPKGIARISRSR